MATIRSSVEIIDITEDDDKSALGALGSARASFAAIVQQKSKESTSPVDIKPIDLDNVETSKSSQSARKPDPVGDSSKNAREIPQSNAYPFLDNPMPGRSGNVTFKSHKEKAGKQTSAEGLPADPKNGQGSGSSSSYAPPALENPSISRERTSVAPARAIDNPFATPQKRKRPSPIPFTQQPTTRVAPRIIWQENGIARLARSPRNLSELPESVQRSKSDIQLPPAVIKSNNDLTKPPTPASMSPSRTKLSNDSRSSSNSTPRSSSRISRRISSTIILSADSEDGLVLPTEGQLESLPDDSKMEFKPLISPSFPPNFDRGRFPHQRRRRVRRGAPNPWVSKGHRNENSFYAAPLSKTPSTYINQANEIVNSSHLPQATSSTPRRLQTHSDKLEYSSAENSNAQLDIPKHLRGGGASERASGHGKPSKLCNPKPTPSSSFPLNTKLPNHRKEDDHVNPHQLFDNDKSKSRPTRAAAGTASSRITSQYENRSETGSETGSETRSGISDSDVKAGSTIFDRQLCPDCDCWISVHNLNVHFRTQKHQNNAREVGAKREEFHPDKTRYSTNRAGTPSSDEQVERLRLRPMDYAFKTPNKIIGRPQRRAVQGTHQTSLAASFATGIPRVFRPFQEPRRRGMIDNVARQRLLDQYQVLQHVDFMADEISTIRSATLQNENRTTNNSQGPFNAHPNGDSIPGGRNEEATNRQIGGSDTRDQQTVPNFLMIESRVKDPNEKPCRQIGSLLRNRELGSSAIGRHVETRSELKIGMAEAIRPWRSFTGASHDVVAVAWAPNSIDFAAGAVTHSNPEDLQYNRPCNLLLGNLCHNTLIELPDHRIDRKKLEIGPNSTDEMFNACDSKVYKTVTSVKFHPAGDQMYTASEDWTVKIWDLLKAQPECSRTLKHEASVTSLDISPLNPGIFATGSQKTKNAIRVFGNVAGQETLTCFSSSRAEMKPEWKLYPEGLHWGPSMNTSHLLLGGFLEYGRNVENANEGHLCLWDVNTEQDLKLMPAAQAIHTAAWHPKLPYFASGGAPGFERTDKQKTKTVVRVWDLGSSRRVAMEYECPAREMTDITFSPLDYNIVTAGCTNSITYVWDWRWPERPLHQLYHGKSVMPTEERDTGVMMSLWGTGGSFFYTGSSDGSIRAWDIRRHPDDVLVSRIAQLDAGVQSGAFSPDGTHLLVGDATGGIHVLSSAPWDPRPSELTWDNVRTKGAPIDIIRAQDGSGRIQEDDDNPGTVGIEAATELLLTGQLMLDPTYGPGKGPNYSGPFALYAREQKLNNDSDIGRLRKDIYKQQPFSRNGNPRPERANPIRILAAARKELLDKNHGEDNKEEIADVTPSTKTEMNEARNLSPSGAIQALNQLEARTSTRDLATLATHKGMQYLSRPSDSPQGANLTTSLVRKGAGDTSNLPSQKFGESCTVSSAAPTSSPNSSIALGFIDNIMPESEMVEENGWWPQLGEQEIARARARFSVRFG